MKYFIAIFCFLTYSYCCAQSEESEYNTVVRTFLKEYYGSEQEEKYREILEAVLFSELKDVTKQLFPISKRHIESGKRFITTPIVYGSRTALVDYCMGSMEINKFLNWRVRFQDAGGEHDRLYFCTCVPN